MEVFHSICLLYWIASLYIMACVSTPVCVYYNYNNYYYSTCVFLCIVFSVYIDCGFPVFVGFILFLCS